MGGGCRGADPDSRTMAPVHSFFSPQHDRRSTPPAVTPLQTRGGTSWAAVEEATCMHGLSWCIGRPPSPLCPAAC